MYVAIRDAFDAIRRQLEDYVRRRRGQIKEHEAPPHGRVAELHADYGKILAPDGQFVYFHRNSLIDTPFEHLRVGTEVRFVQEMGELGPQATSVYVIGKHHIVGS